MLTRRSWLKLSSLAGAAIALSGRKAPASSGAGLEIQGGPRVSREQALSWVRYVNTAQWAHRRQHGTFAGHDALTDSTALGLARTMPTLPHAYRGLVELLGGRERYFVMVQEIATGFAYQSDQRGVIFEGVSRPIGEVVSAQRWELEGAPISPGPPRRAFSAMAAPLLAVADILIPGIRAQTKDDDKNCPGPCVFNALCGECRCECTGLCGARCCNWGTVNCTWCCSPTWCC
jgi:hypothetical protein